MVNRLHRAQRLEIGGPWQSAVNIASASFRKSLNARKRPRKNWTGGKGRKIRPLTLTSLSSPMERRDISIVVSLSQLSLHNTAEIADEPQSHDFHPCFAL
jgi:hypothetical protein